MMTKIALLSFLLTFQSGTSFSPISHLVVTARTTAVTHKSIYPQQHRHTVRLFAVPPVPTEKSDEEWKSELPSEVYYVLREEGTEPAFSSTLNDIKADGTFSCAGCGSPLFRTKSKFESGTGWPSFYAPLDAGAVDLSADFKLILPRTECSCASCGGHLGHVFDDGPRPTGQRYCMNGVAMSFRSDALEEEDSNLLESILHREASSSVPKPPLLTVIPLSLLYGGAAFGYGDSFIKGFLVAKKGGVSFPSTVFDIFPLALFVVCSYLALRGLVQLF